MARQADVNAVIRKITEDARAKAERAISEIATEAQKKVQAVLGSKSPLTHLARAGTLKRGSTSRGAATTAGKVASRSSARAPQKSAGGRGNVQSEVLKVLKRRKNGMTMESLMEALPENDKKSLTNATFNLRQKGTVEKDGKVYRIVH